MTDDDAIVAALDRITKETKALRSDLEGFRRSALLSRVAIVLVIVLATVGFVLLRSHDSAQRAQTRCTIYNARVRDHSTTVTYLRKAVAGDSTGRSFVDGLEKAYRVDDNLFAKQLHLDC